MKILFAASEAVPFAKTGGLADVAGSLPQALAALGHDVRLVMPRYRNVDPVRFGLKERAIFSVPIGSWHERCEVLEGRLGKNVIVYFISKDTYYDRADLYQTKQGDYPDNAERFTFFSRAALELCKAIGFSPDIVHGNDWQTGLVSFFLKTIYGGAPPFERTKSVFTVHNLGYQGNFWHWDMRYLGDLWQHYTPEGLEFWDHVSFLKAGLVYSDIITTVSRTYSREIQTEEYGHGLEGVLAKRSKDLVGIVNGIDYEEWDPARDRTIAKQYTRSRLAGKSACKSTILRKTGLPDQGLPLAGMVTRLVDQKGLDILSDALPDILKLDVQLLILGTGDLKYHEVLSEAAAASPDRMRVLLTYDDLLAKSIYAGCDMFLMPSRYEPCGLGQLIALRYGTVPLVRKTGGLTDTVQDYKPRTGRGTGFVFEHYTAQALVKGLERALAVYRMREEWKALMRAGMQQDFSWDHSAQEYEKVYRKVMRKK